MDFLKKYNQQEEARLAKIMLGPVRGEKKMFATVLILISVVSSATAIYFWNKSNIELSQKNAVVKNPTSEQSLAQILAEVSKLMILPEGEEPTMATVADLDKLKNRQFFAKASIGDKVLIYAKAKKIILYDPSAKKIVEIAPLNINEN